MTQARAEALRFIAEKAKSGVELRGCEYYRNSLDFRLLFTYFLSRSEQGKTEEARAEAAEILRINPQYSLAVVRRNMPYQNPAVVDRVATALEKAGLH